jgi:iron complex transport system ATP-binding protein
MMANTENWRLTLRDVAAQRGGRAVLRGVTMEIRPGECVAIIGPNGAGKTTLLLTLLGLLHATGGEVQLNGRDLRRFSARERGRFASYVPQTVERLPGFTVHELAIASRHPHIPPLQPVSRRDSDAVRTALQMCGMTALEHRPVNGLSGGERKKAMLAAAFAQEPSLLVLDEPNTALDPAYQVDLAGLLTDWLGRDSARSLVLVSHDLQLPAVLRARVVALREGAVVADGPSGDVLRPETLERVFSAGFDSVRDGLGRVFVMPRWR